MRAYERFIEYAKIWTSSEWNSTQEPSSMRQFDLAHQLAFELRELGLLAPLDTHPDCPGQNVRPQLTGH